MGTRVRISPSRTRARLARSATVLTPVSVSLLGAEKLMEVGSLQISTLQSITLLGIEIEKEVGRPSVSTSSGVITIPAALGVEKQLEVGVLSITQVHEITATGVEKTIEVGTLEMTEGGAPITFSAAYIPGGSGSGPTLNITEVVLGATTGPWDVFIATHPAATTLDADQVIAGTGATLDAVSILDDADGTISGAELELSTSMTGGRMSIVMRDSLGATSNVITLDNVDVDATAPTISAVSGTSTGPTTASYSVTTNEAGGTLYVRARPSGDSAWTAEQIIAAPDATDTTVEAG